MIRILWTDTLSTYLHIDLKIVYKPKKCISLILTPNLWKNNQVQLSVPQELLSIYHI